MKRSIRGRGGVVQLVAWVYVIAGFPFISGAESEQSLSSADYLNRLEWRGMLVLQGEVQFSFHDQAGGQSFWISAGQTRNGVEVVEYNQRENEVILRLGNSTQSIALSGSSVVALEEESSTAPAPLVRIPESADEANEGGDASAPERDKDDTNQELNRVERLWAEAVEQSSYLREIDSRFRQINVEEKNVAETLSGLDSDDPVDEYVFVRQRELPAERLALFEEAREELRELAGQASGSGGELEESLGDYLSQLLPPDQPDSDEVLKRDEE